MQNANKMTNNLQQSCMGIHLTCHMTMSYISLLLKW